MTKQEIFDKITDLLNTEFDLPKEKLVPEARMHEDLDLDSIDAVDMIVRLQKMTGIRVQPEEFKQIRTLWDITEVVYKVVNTD